MSRFELDVFYARAKAKLWDKIERLRLLAKEGPLRLGDFGTRRRHGFLWQRWCIASLMEGLGRNFTGTSNVKHALDLGCEAIGTNAHELPMVFAAQANSDGELRRAPFDVLEAWSKLYAGNLLVLLPDTFGTTNFLAAAPDWAADWTGAAARFQTADRGGGRTHRLVARAWPRPAREARDPVGRHDDRLDRGERAGPA